MTAKHQTWTIAVLVILCIVAIAHRTSQPKEIATPSDAAIRLNALNAQLFAESPVQEPNVVIDAAEANGILSSEDAASFKVEVIAHNIKWNQLTQTYDSTQP